MHFLRRRPRQKGSLLIVAMLLSAIIAVSLGSYINLSITALRTADRSFYANSTVDLAEIGVEQAMSCFYTLTTGVDAATAWTGWTLSGTTATRTFSGFTPGPNASGVVKVYVQNYTMAATPVVVTQATITPASGATMNKWIELTLRPRGLFSRGLVARNSITFTGNASVDSWHSDPDNDPGTAPVAYSSSVRKANGTIGCQNSANGAINIGNGDVFGYVSTGGGSISHGPNGVVSGSFSGTGVDSSRVTRDFSANFPSTTVPSPSAINNLTTSPTAGTAFPRGGDAIASDSKYYYNFAIGTNINLSGTSEITVNGHCVFIMNNHQGVSAIDTSGNAAVRVASAASLIIYTNGNISASGNGIMNNATQPERVQIYGTSTTSQSLTMVGNGSGGGAIYMPNGSITVTGNGVVKGAIVGREISMTGNAAFHYDEALGNLNATAGVTVTKWRELQTASERADYSSHMNF